MTVLKVSHARHFFVFPINKESCSPLLPSSHKKTQLSYMWPLGDPNIGSDGICVSWWCRGTTSSHWNACMGGSTWKYVGSEAYVK